MQDNFACFLLLWMKIGVSDWFLLPKKYIANPEALLRKNRSRTASSFTTPPSDKPIAPAPSAPIAVANKSLREFFIPAIANVLVGPAINIGDKNFELHTGLIMMV